MFGLLGSDVKLPMRPCILALDTAGNLLVADDESNVVTIYDKQGALLCEFEMEEHKSSDEHAGTREGTVLMAMCVDKEDRILVASKDEVQVFGFEISAEALARAVAASAV